MVVGRDDDIGSVGACTVCPPLEKQLVWLFTMPYRKVFRRFKGARTSLSEAEEKIAAEKTSAAIAALFSAPGALLMNRARDRKCGLMRLACNALATGHQLLGGIVVGGGEGGEEEEKEEDEEGGWGGGEAKGEEADIDGKLISSDLQSRPALMSFLASELMNRCLNESGLGPSVSTLGICKLDIQK
jgi:hypothetical protein